MATGAYLFGKDKNGKRIPVEIEHLTQEEREKNMRGRTESELINWIQLLCETINEMEDFLKTEGYSKKE